ncbi:hypothetical protein NDU88_001886 [Pleurodeles waltl]|uniref:Uncharacterized protein n=1 Tax=Pleurodeles waltl TaxID=8319 RepID=A0AAV7VBA9_PLEWA|nr:hypothetical protein NDU88_001886 [Pleurodeles waltl]
MSAPSVPSRIPRRQMLFLRLLSSRSVSLLRRCRSSWSLLAQEAAWAYTVITRWSSSEICDWKPAISRRIDLVSAVSATMALSIPSSVRPTADISCSIRSIDASCVSSAMLVSAMAQCTTRPQVQGHQSPARLGGDAVGDGGGAQQHPLPSGSKEEGGASPAPSLSSFPGCGLPAADLCPVLRSPQVQRRVVTARRGRRVRHRPLNASSGGCSSEGRGRKASYRESPGGASLRCGPACHLRPRLVFLPQASDPCSALPTVHQGRVPLLRSGRRPPTASGPSHMLRHCPGGLR